MKDREDVISSSAAAGSFPGFLFYNPCTMRIISIRVEPVARVLAIAYSFFGLVAFIVFAAGSAEALTLPFGVLAPLFQLNVNLNLPRSGGILYNIFSCAAAVLSYSVTGWITGAAAAICFNVIAKWRGGIDAKYVRVAKDQVLVGQHVEEGTRHDGSIAKS